MRKLSKNKQKIIILDIIIVLCWMATVFVFSGQDSNTSNGLSRSIAERLVDVVHRDEEISSQERVLLLRKYNHKIRKMAHFTIYLIGGLTIISLMRTLISKKSIIILATSLCGFLYAMSDEFHQGFIEGRGPMLSDVLLDTLGVITGVIIYLILSAMSNKIKAKNKN